MGVVVGGDCNDGDHEFLMEGGLGARLPWHGDNGDAGGTMDGHGEFVCGGGGGGGEEERSRRGDDDDGDSDKLWRGGDGDGDGGGH